VGEVGKFVEPRGTVTMCHAFCHLRHLFLRHLTLSARIRRRSKLLTTPRSKQSWTPFIIAGTKRHCKILYGPRMKVPDTRQSISKRCKLRTSTGTPHTTPTRSSRSQELVTLDRWRPCDIDHRHLDEWQHTNIQCT
jgi:hypothetical protein